MIGDSAPVGYDSVHLRTVLRVFQTCLMRFQQPESSVMQRRRGIPERQLEKMMGAVRHGQRTVKGIELKGDGVCWSEFVEALGQRLHVVWVK